MSVKGHLLALQQTSLMGKPDIVVKFAVLLATSLLFLLCTSLTKTTYAGPLPQTSSGVAVATHLFSDDGRNSFAPIEYGTETSPMTVAVGSLITHTIWISNSSDQPMLDVQLTNIIPRSGLEGIRCVSATHPYMKDSWEQALPSLCELAETGKKIEDPLGGFTIISQTRSISWTISTIPAKSSWAASFAGLTTGVQGSASETLENTLYVNYSLGGNLESANIRSYVQPILPTDGKSILGQAPVWLSSDLGGTLSSDWGDFDSDGDLDLALALTGGTAVYQNVDGYLELFWEEQDNSSLGVRWANINHDLSPELIVIGGLAEQAADLIEPLQPGQNLVYAFDPTATSASRRFQVDRLFSSSHQLARLEVGDFTADGFIDLIGGTNAINPTCPVHLFTNDGAGNLIEDSCISTSASAAFGSGDVDNDNDLDLAIGQFPNQIRLLINDGTGDFAQQPAIQIDSAVQFLPYDLSWGDFDSDGFLDLAAAFPLQRESRIYRNAGSGAESIAGASADTEGLAFERPVVIRSTDFMTPLSIDWGDFDGDGQLDLAVADEPPTIYSYNLDSSAFTPIHQISGSALRGQVWSIRAIDVDGNGSVELAITDRSGPSLLYQNLTPRIATSLTPLPDQIGFSSTPANAIAWGDIDSDGDLDLLVGAADAGPGALGSKFYPNNNGQFDRDEIQLTDPVAGDNLGQSIAIADADGDGALDIAVGSQENLLLYRFGNRETPAGSLAIPVSALAWGDADGDGQLELLAVGPESTTIYRVDLSQPSPADVFQPLWTTTSAASGQGASSAASGQGASSAAWADFNRDGFLDFVVGHINAPTILYCNTGNNLFSQDTFQPIWQSSAMPTSSVAWGDANKDGWLDLAIGNNGEENRIYQNDLPRLIDTLALSGPEEYGCTEQGTGLLSTTAPLAELWRSSEISNTTAIAWGDVDNDGDVDLAVGNQGETDVIYMSEGTTWAPRWWSQEAHQTSGLAWGDLDGDGDLDLAISQNGQGQNGYYLNSYATPSHLEANYPQTMSLPQQPAYIGLRRPGRTADAYLFSAAEILSGPAEPVVTIPYDLFDPDGSRDPAVQNAAGDSLLETRFEYSLWGNEWQPATEKTPSQSTITQTARLGENTLFLWDAQANEAVGEDVRFRVTATESAPSGGAQRVKSSAVTPSFRVRGTTCIWPEEPEIIVQRRFADDEPWQALDNQLQAATASFSYVIDAANVAASTEIQLRFVGKIGAGTGAMAFQWEFDPAIQLRSGGTVTETVGQLIETETESSAGYNVNLTITGEPCPQNRPRYAEAIIGNGATFRNDEKSHVIYLPISMGNGTSALSGTSDEAPTDDVLSVPPPKPLEHLTSVLDAASRSITIEWNTHPEEDLLTGYRVYRFPITELFDPTAASQPQLFAKLTANARRVEDVDSECGMGYYITATGVGGESAPSASTVYGWPCNE